MENIDLNLENYSLDDILDLFKLPYQFTEQHLKQAKRIVYQTHPDKSDLPKECRKSVLTYSMISYVNKCVDFDGCVHVAWTFYVMFF